MVKYMRRPRQGAVVAPDADFYEGITLPETRAQELEQRDALDVLGLDEVEAVEYALMLSRDEEALRQQDDEELASIIAESSTDLVDEDDLLFEMTDDFDNMPSSFRRQRTLSRSSNTSSSATSAASHRTSSSPYLSTPTPSPKPTSAYNSSPSLSPTGSSKVRISPRLRDEPLEAGGLGLSMSPLSLARINTNVWQTPPANHTPEDFPSFAITPGSGSRHTAASLSDWTSVRSASPGDNSPPSGQRSWSAVARSTSSAGTSPTIEAIHRAPSTSSNIVSGSTPRAATTASLVSATRPTTNVAPDFDNEDDELQYVLQLSLAEARSRGEV